MAMLEDPPFYTIWGFLAHQSIPVAFMEQLTERGKIQIFFVQDKIWTKAIDFWSNCTQGGIGGCPGRLYIDPKGI